MERVVVQSDGAEGKLHGSTGYPFFKNYTPEETGECSGQKTTWLTEPLIKTESWKSACVTFVLSVDVIADVQVKVCDLEVVGCLAHIVGAEQLGHGRALVSSRGRLLGAHLLGCQGRRRHLENTGSFF